MYEKFGAKFMFSIVLIMLFVYISLFVSGNFNENSQHSKKNELTEILANQQETTIPELLTREELSVYLGISEEEVGKLAPTTSEGYSGIVIPYIKIGNNVFFPKKAVDKWLLNLEAISVE